MKEIRAFEYNNKIYRTEREAFEEELYDDVTNLFANDSSRDIIVKIVYEKDVQNELVRIIKKYQEAEV